MKTSVLNTRETEIAYFAKLIAATTEAAGSTLFEGTFETAMW